jgi:hypothetical protein
VTTLSLRHVTHYRYAQPAALGEGQPGDDDVGRSDVRGERRDGPSRRAESASENELRTAMLIRAGYDISLRCDTVTPVLALLTVHPSRAA